MVAQACTDSHGERLAPEGAWQGPGVTGLLSLQLQHQASKALWFLKQSVALFRSPQAAIRQAAIWFAGTAVVVPQMG